MKRSRIFASAAHENQFQTANKGCGWRKTVLMSFVVTLVAITLILLLVFAFTWLPRSTVIQSLTGKQSELGIFIMLFVVLIHYSALVSILSAKEFLEGLAALPKGKKILVVTLPQIVFQPERLPYGVPCLDVAVPLATEGGPLNSACLSTQWHETTPTLAVRRLGDHWGRVVPFCLQFANPETFRRKRTRYAPSALRQTYARTSHQNVGGQRRTCNSRNTRVDGTALHTQCRLLKVRKKIGGSNLNFPAFLPRKISTRFGKIKNSFF